MQMLDCYDSEKRYIGLFMVNSFEELITKHPGVKYVACTNAETGEKIICAVSEYGIFTDNTSEIVPEPLSGITSYSLPKNIKISEPKQQKHFRDFADEEDDVEEDVVQLDALNEVRIKLQSTIKEKESKKKSLLAEVRILRQEIKELQQQLAEL